MIFTNTNTNTNTMSKSVEEIAMIINNQIDELLKQKSNKTIRYFVPQIVNDEIVVFEKENNSLPYTITIRLDISNYLIKCGFYININLISNDGMKLFPYGYLYIFGNKCRTFYFDHELPKKSYIIHNNITKQYVCELTKENIENRQKILQWSDYIIFCESEVLLVKKENKIPNSDMMNVTFECNIEINKSIEPQLEEQSLIKKNQAGLYEFLLQDISSYYNMNIYGITSSNTFIMEYVKNNNVNPVFFSGIMKYSSYDILKHINKENQSLEDYIEMYIKDDNIKNNVLIQLKTVINNYNMSPDHP